MTTIHSRRGFTLAELFGVIAVIGIVLALVIPAIQRSRETERKHVCEGRVASVGMALLNAEQVYGEFPLATQLKKSQLSAARTAMPASTAVGPTEAGWSWIVRILPFLGDKGLYGLISAQSNQFTIPTGPFDPSICHPNSPHQHAACESLPMLICPSWEGNNNTRGQWTIDTTASNPPTGAPEYANVDTSLPGTGAQSYRGKVTPTNYKVIVGTHIARQDGNLAPVENGAFQLTAPRGTLLSEITDGTANTLLIAETKECGYASWYDGTLNWLVTNNPNAALPPGNAGAPDNPPWTKAEVGLDAGYVATDPNSRPWLTIGMISNSIRGNVNWGPSSDHPHGIVMHVFCDDHVTGITDKVDPATYLDLTTRAGGEVVNGCGDCDIK